MTGIELIAKERRRQIEQEGWTAEHDARHVNGELAQAASCYAFRSSLYVGNGSKYRTAGGGAPSQWPWRKKWWKPKTVLRDLVRAGALIAAEIDRLLVEEAKR